VKRFFWAMVVWTLVCLPVALAGKIENPEADIRAAIADAPKVLVVSEPNGDWGFFPVSGIGEVSGAKVTVKAGAFVITQCPEGSGSPKKMAEQYRTLEVQKVVLAGSAQ